MKVAQLLATIPEALPAEYAQELSQLQSQAPPMGPAFVRRRMMAELGPEWAARFKSFETQPAASASLGQVHRAIAHDGRALAAKLQYPDMQSAVEADLNQLKVVFALHARMNPAVETADILKEVSARLREELDYELEAAHTALYALIFKDEPRIRVPEVLAGPVDQAPADHDLARGPQAARLQGGAAGGSQRHRAGDVQGVVVSVLALRRDPRRPAPRQLHDLRGGQRGRANGALGKPAGINLLDYGCIRTFPTPFVQGVIDLYNGLLHGKRELVVHAYETWGFGGLSNELIDILNIWARFIYGPLLDDREREIADGTTPGQYGRKEAFTVHKQLQGERPGAGAARVRVHGPGGDRARRRVPAPAAPSSTGTTCSTRPSRDSCWTRWRSGRKRRLRRRACRCRRLATRVPQSWVDTASPNPRVILGLVARIHLAGALTTCGTLGSFGTSRRG